MAGPMERRTGGPSQYDVARQQAAQRENATRQQTGDAISRRFAAMGGGPGGAQIKVQQDVADQSAKRLEGTMQQIDSAERAENERKAEVEAGRTFAREERLGSQGFAADQSALQRRFASDEARLGRDWQTGERLGSQAYGTSEREGTQAFQKALADRQNEIDMWKFEEGQDFQEKMLGKEQSFAKKMQGLQQDFANSQLDKQLTADWNKWSEEFKQSKWVDEQNLILANKMLEQKDMLEELFGNFSMGNLGGFFGGIGTKLGGWNQGSSNFEQSFQLPGLSGLGGGGGFF